MTIPGRQNDPPIIIDAPAVTDVQARRSDGLLSLIGRTPMVPLRLRAKGRMVCARCEFLDASGSIKDRLARCMILRAEEAGRRIQLSMRLILISTECRGTRAPLPQSAKAAAGKLRAGGIGAALPRFIKTAALALAVGGYLVGAQAELRIPAYTAYLEPEPSGARVSQKSGISDWQGAGLKVLWFGQFTNAGPADCSVELKLPSRAQSRLRLTMGGASREAIAEGPATGPALARFGAYQISAPGYERFCLESLNQAGTPAGDIQALLLEGPVVMGAQFNLQPRRNAASVHLMYPVPNLTNVEAFYCEVTAVEDPLLTFYMACGWHRGYFGMQVNSPAERRIIFSVWDSGREAVDRAKVAAENRVVLLAKGEGVDAGDFGNEGTGGHSHLVYSWKTGEKQRFIVTARPTDATHTIYSGYYFHPERKKWELISSWKTPADGGYLRGLHSFSEDFGDANGQLRRKALFGNQWVRTADGRWLELTQASFSHDPTGRADRLDRFMGVEQGQFFLSHGGFIPGFTKYGEKFVRPALRDPPADIVLPEIHE